MTLQQDSKKLAQAFDELKEKKEVTRYNLEDIGHAYSEYRDMRENELGEWVDYEDYEALEAKNKKLRELIDAMFDLLQKTQMIPSEIYLKYQSLIE